MKNYQKILFAALAAGLLSLAACSNSNQAAGSEGEALAGDSATTGVEANTGASRYDTTVTGVSGNTNAVNAEGNAGNGSGMGSGSATEAQQH